MITHAVRVALDLLGGDGAPDVVVDGALLAVDEPGVEVLLVGPPDVANQALVQRGVAGRLQVVPARESVGMAEDPVPAVRAKRDATVRVATRLVRDGAADAVVSAGSTGALVVAAVLTLGRLPGVTRPAIAVTVPGADGAVVLVDAGANVECTPQLLAQFALSGAAYAVTRLDRRDPRVGLLCNGTEPGKGDELRRAAFAALAELPLTFVGYVESGSLTAGDAADVVVTDGFTGNIVLKGIEGMHALARAILTKELGNPADALAALDPLGADRLGGGLLLGVPGTVVVAHGASSAPAIAACVRQAVEAVRERVVPRVADALAVLVTRGSSDAGLAQAAPQ